MHNRMEQLHTIALGAQTQKLVDLERTMNQQQIVREKLHNGEVQRLKKEVGNQQVEIATLTVQVEALTNKINHMGHHLGQMAPLPGPAPATVASSSSAAAPPGFQNLQLALQHSPPGPCTLCNKTWTHNIQTSERGYLGWWEHMKSAPVNEMVFKFLHSCSDCWLLRATTVRSKAVSKSLTNELKPITFDNRHPTGWVLIQYKANKWIVVGCKACNGYEECHLEDLEGMSADEDEATVAGAGPGRGAI